MEASSYLSSCRPTLPKRLRQSRRKGHNIRVVRASCGRNEEGKMVDENMIVLRLRIKKMEMLEMNREAPAEWMDWEKQYYDQYDEDVCNAIGLLQSFLMETRPSFALGMVTLIAFSLPISSATLLFSAFQIGKTMFSSFGLC
ncbi:uncharacterized protein LOC106758516 [Vigna radiata var. radiata]|uniref:Uncharacterized protein LOC106758516 n=1 Tax=Vigna radiata var. radiata TaxID=3916 RepID=A0A1S3TT08_VIGRR|nr:uncharacterized protein LOC106758516 [Vigna radiata var. radiata]